MLAKDGEEAVQMFTENHERHDRIDLLLLDVMMSRMGGPEAFERIRQLGGDVPIIFMTGYSPDMVQNRIQKQNISLGESGPVIIQQPYDIDGRGRTIREVLAGGSSNVVHPNHSERKVQ